LGECGEMRRVKKFILDSNNNMILRGGTIIQEQKAFEKAQPNGYASLDAGGKVPIDQMASGTPDGTKFIRDDRTLEVPAGGTGYIFTGRYVSAADKVIGDFNNDGAWHDLDLSAIAPEEAKVLCFRISFANDVVGSTVAFRKNGETYSKTPVNLVLVATIEHRWMMEVECDSGRIIEYLITANVWTSLELVVVGWWK